MPEASNHRVVVFFELNISHAAINAASADIEVYWYSLSAALTRSMLRLLAY
jgi:hypothetical protein